MKITIKAIITVFSILTLISLVQADAKTIQGGISYELNDIQKLAFKNEKFNISTKMITKYLKDKNESSNLQYLRTNTRSNLVSP